MQRLMPVQLLLGSNAYGFEETAEAVMRLLDCLFDEKAVMVGYSLGARLALHLAAKHGQRFQTVVSVSGGLGLSGETFAGPLPKLHPCARHAVFRNCNQLAGHKPLLGVER